jgi:hypothetical protein
VKKSFGKLHNLSATLPTKQQLAQRDIPSETTDDRQAIITEVQQL